MKITQPVLPPTAPMAAPEVVSQPETPVEQTQDTALEAVEQPPQASNPFQGNLDGQMQKARIANLFSSPIYAAPKAVKGALQGLKSPDAGLHTPKAGVLQKLDGQLKAALEKAKSGNPEDLAAADEALKNIVQAYGIGQDGVTSLQYDPKAPDQADTRGTDILVAKSGLESPAEAASTILHESNHARRNQQLTDLKIDRGKFGIKAEAIYSNLSEIEGYDLEIRNAKKLGTSDSYVKGAQKLKDQYMHELEMAGAGKDLIDLVKSGQFDKAQEKFRHDVLKQ